MARVVHRCHDREVDENSSNRLYCCWSYRCLAQVVWNHCRSFLWLVFLGSSRTQLYVSIKTTFLGPDSYKDIALSIVSDHLCMNISSNLRLIFKFFFTGSTFNTVHLRFVGYRQAMSSIYCIRGGGVEPDIARQGGPPTRRVSSTTELPNTRLVTFFTMCFVSCAVQQ